MQRDKRENASINLIHPARRAPEGPLDPLVTKVLQEHQVHLENVVILVSQERRETKESLVPPGNEDPLVHLAKTVRTNNYICIYKKITLHVYYFIYKVTTSHIISIQQEPKVIRETRETMDFLETREIRERREIRRQGRQGRSRITRCPWTSRKGWKRWSEGRQGRQRRAWLPRGTRYRAGNHYLVGRVINVCT